MTTANVNAAADSTLTAKTAAEVAWFDHVLMAEWLPIDVATNDFDYNYHSAALNARLAVVWSNGNAAGLGYLAGLNAVAYAAYVDANGDTAQWVWPTGKMRA